MAALRLGEERRQLPRAEGVRPSLVTPLERVGKGGEIKHGTLDETTYTWKLDTFARQIRMSRQDFFNDSIGFLPEAVGAMAPIGMRAIADLVYSTLLGAGSFFSSQNKNLLASSALSFDSLRAGISAMRRQTDSAGNNLDMLPAALLVPDELGLLAQQLLQSEFTERVATATNVDAVRGTGNPLRNAVALAVEPRLSNAAKFSGTSATSWYLAAGPQANPMTVGFLDGRETPTVEFFGFDSDPDTLGVSWRVYHDFGAAMGDEKAILKATA